MRSRQHSLSHLFRSRSSPCCCCLRQLEFAVHTKVLFGDPSKPGFYSILLFVPAHTTIQAHTHRDDRMATVVSGMWYFGYGDHFDAKSLKRLPPGSVYSEPAAHTHFARTDRDAVIVHIAGYGPTNTRYFDPANEPKTHRN